MPHGDLPTIDSDGFERIPLAVYDSATVSPGDRRTTFSFEGHPGTATDIVYALKDEWLLVDRAVSVRFARAFILEQFGLSGVWISLGLGTQGYLLPITACELRPESGKTITHVYGPQGQDGFESLGPPTLTAAVRSHLDH